MGISGIKSTVEIPNIELKSETAESTIVNKESTDNNYVQTVELDLSAKSFEQQLPSSVISSKKGIDTTEFGKSLIEKAVQANGSERILIASKVVSSGGDRANTIRQGIINQLLSESTINTDSGYSGKLHRLASEIHSKQRELPQGTYTPVAIENPRLHSTLPNAVPSGKYSKTPAEARAQVERFDKEITQLERQIRVRDEAAANASIPSGTLLGGETGDVGAAADAAQLRIKLFDLNIKKAAFINDARLSPTRNFDNTINQALANPADAGKPPVIFINGFNTDANRSGLQALELANRFRSPVTHVGNVSSIISFARGTVKIIGETAKKQGVNTNLNAVDQRIEQHLVGNRPAATTTANLILDQLFDSDLRKNNTPVKIVGYSQGAAIAAQAIKDVESHLSQLVRTGQLTRNEKVQMLGRLRLLGVGAGAAERHLDQSFVKGQIQSIPDLSKINYRIIHDRNDPITRLVGVGDNKVTLGDLTGRVRKAAQDLGDYKKILPHLSYFQQYENTDPGARFNPRAGQEFDNWFSGKNIKGVIDIAP